jgi:hypothetical protein
VLGLLGLLGLEQGVLEQARAVQAPGWQADRQVLETQLGRAQAKGRSRAWRLCPLQ